MFYPSISRGRRGTKENSSLLKRRRFPWLPEGLCMLVHFYQLTFSIFFGPCCRFNPSCSSYALISIRRFGILKGLNLTLKRVFKCHPFHPGGYDPVPEIPHPFSLKT